MYISELSMAPRDLSSSLNGTLSRGGSPSRTAIDRNSTQRKGQRSSYFRGPRPQRKPRPLFDAVFPQVLRRQLPCRPPGKSGSWENYVSISFHIEWDMIVVTVFLLILKGKTVLKVLKGKLSPRSYSIKFERYTEFSQCTARPGKSGAGKTRFPFPFA